jgi:hypothetical protein
VQKSRGKGDRREKGAGGDATPDTSQRGHVDGGGELEGDRQGGGGRDDEPARERLLVAGSAEEREKTDRPEDRKDDD